MKTNYYSEGVMRRMRLFTYDIEKNYHSQDKRIEELKQLRAADEITQTVFDREVASIQETIKRQRIALVEEAKKNLISTFQKMREIANNRIIKPPTTEIVNTLQLLSMLEKITPICPASFDGKGGVHRPIDHEGNRLVHNTYVRGFRYIYGLHDFYGISRLCLGNGCLQLFQR